MKSPTTTDKYPALSTWLGLVTRPARVLVVEDDKAFAELVLHVMRDFHCEPRLVHDGQAAIDTVQSEPPFDLVILDYALPRRSAKEVLDAIYREHPDTPVVVLSGVLTQQALDEVGEYGLVVFACKPTTATIEGLTRLLRVLGIRPIKPP